MVAQSRITQPDRRVSQTASQCARLTATRSETCDGLPQRGLRAHVQRTYRAQRDVELPADFLVREVLESDEMAQAAGPVVDAAEGLADDHDRVIRARGAGFTRQREIDLRVALP